MLIKRIRAQNFKTYVDLDLDLSVTEERPIILVGGKNGGGKTTLFEAIYCTLYGLKISNAKQFNEYVNAGLQRQENEKITLELHFSGKVLRETHHYVLTRVYMLNTMGQPVESVKLNMNGSIFQYGTATPPTQRAEQKNQVNKIIEANLPERLSKYFLFDAMEAGNLLKEDQLNQVIRENIENVMGFKKFLHFATAAGNLFQEYTAQRLKQESEKQDYLRLIERKKQLQKELAAKEQEYQKNVDYLLTNQAFYQSLKEGFQEQAVLQNKLQQLESQVKTLLQKESTYKNHLQQFIETIEWEVGIPHVLQSIQSEIVLALKEKKEKEHLTPTQVESIVIETLNYLKAQNLLGAKEVAVGPLVAYILEQARSKNARRYYSFWDEVEIQVLENTLNNRYSNAFLWLDTERNHLNLDLANLETLEVQKEQLKAQISGKDYSFIKEYEKVEQVTKQQQQIIQNLKNEIANLEKKIASYDINIYQEPDIRYETLGKLKDFFKEVTSELLKAKKTQIELKMKEDLNINLEPYKGMISRVELSENLDSLTFKLYHQAGNEIFLNQLNTASKQIVVQVLLKALREFGDYDPPVMIDTVMGVLDESSRATLLENYFPALSHQTILLSSDSEIRKDNDWVKIKPFVAKAYTLERDREKQCTYVVEGYFGEKVEN
ncbi:MAG: DNA sulfur modification protein DndD [Bacteroidia bacterium]|nr:DNA sulfur modification protein DndD [Bacteroidia bacterium]MDW8159726.1 DNA sulfur modification protein DndD [Bacteroidia bacterium]